MYEIEIHAAEKKMLVYRRAFQSFDSNRLRRHRFYSIAQHKARRTVCTINESDHRIVRPKSDLITHNDHIQNFDADHLINQIPRKHEPFATSKVLPIESMPCADTLNTSRFGHLMAMAHLVRQLVTGKWENRFHEEIDECHHRLGPIFRKSLAPNQSGELLPKKKTKKSVRSLYGLFDFYWCWEFPRPTFPLNAIATCL